MTKYPVGAIWLRVLACLAVVITTCGIKNYLAIALSGTAACAYLCPSIFPIEFAFSFPFFDWLFETQRAAQEQIQALVDPLIADDWNLASSLLIAPVFEELLYRGPMFLTRGLIHKPLWWLLGGLLTLLFALSHGRSGLALLPLVVLGTSGLWLIARTHRFWPTVALHSLYNFFFSSVLLYQSFLLGD